MSWFVCVVGWVLTGLAWAASSAAVFAGILLSSDPIGGAGAFGLFLSVVGTAASSLVWDGQIPDRPLPRADRKRLRDEERRIRLQREIEYLERDTGQPMRGA